MAAQISSWLCQPFTTPTAFNATNTAGVGSGTATGTASTTVYYRQYLARASGTSAGTATDPHEFGAYVQGRLNASGTTNWIVRMRTDGRWEITNTGGTWTITWDGTGGTNMILRDALGYTANIGSTAANTYAAATYVPPYAVVGVCRAEATGWQPRMEAAYSALPDGTAYEFRTGYVELAQSFDWKFFPTDQATATAEGDKHSPMEADTSRWKQPGSGVLGTSFFPWSVNDFLFTCGGFELGAAFGTFQDLVAGTSNAYDAVSLDSASRDPGNWVPTQTGWSKRRDVNGLRFRWIGRESRV